MSTLRDYRVSGFTSDGRSIYHPDVFRQMVLDGVIDQRGYLLPAEPEPVIDRSKPPTHED